MRLHAAAALVVALCAAPATAQEAEDALAPTPVGVTQTVPPDGASIPTNARLVALGTVAPAQITFTRVHDDGTRDVLEPDASIAGSFVIPLGDIGPGENVVVETGCAGCGARQFAFVGGADADSTAPVFAAGRAQVTATDFTDGAFSRKGYEVDLAIPAVTDASGPFAVIDIRPDEAPEFLVVTAAGTTTASYTVEGADERTTCATVTAFDVAGNATELADRACVDLKHTAEGAGFLGCASVSPASSSSFALFAAALFFSRRIRR